MKRIDDKRRKRVKRKIRIRKKLSGSKKIPRLTVFRSNRYTYLQVIDDLSGNTLASVSNREKDLLKLKNRVADAHKLGEKMGERLKEKKIKSVVFDRNGYPYHGIIKSIAEGTRKAGIKF